MGQKFKITNISRTGTKPGVMLDLGTNTQNGMPKQIIPPTKFLIVDEIDDTVYGWQAKGYAKVEVLKDPYATVEAANVEPLPVSAKVEDVHFTDDVDMEEEEPDLSMAVEAELPNEGVVRKTTTQTPTSPKANAKASAMGSEGVRKIGKNKEIDALNPLLDEKAKSIDNMSDKFTAKAPRTEGPGRVITP